MDVVITSREQFADPTYLPLFAGDIVISIEAPGYTHPRQRASVPRLDIQFEDVTEELMGDSRLLRPIDESQAAVIVDFMESYSSEADRLIVHCAAGISRSPGVAVGLSRYFDLNLSENDLRDKYPHFNIIVAQRIWAECEKRRYVPRFN